jgi:putative redox protein
MRATVAWQGEARFVGAADSGHRVVMDGPPDAGGTNQGPRPMEMVLLGLGGCSAFDVVHILRRGRHAIEDCAVHIDADRAETDPKVFTRIHLHFVVRGEGLTDKAVGRAVGLSAEKYCSVARMLAGTATISHDWRVEGDG